MLLGHIKTWLLSGSKSSALASSVDIVIEFSNIPDETSVTPEDSQSTTKSWKIYHEMKKYFQGFMAPFQIDDHVGTHLKDKTHAKAGTSHRFGIKDS